MAWRMLQSCAPSLASGVAKNIWNTRVAAVAEASMSSDAARDTPRLARGFLKDLPGDKHGIFIPFNEDAYFMCCEALTDEEKRHHLAKEVAKSPQQHTATITCCSPAIQWSAMTLPDAIEMVVAMGKAKALPHDREVVYFRHAVLPTSDEGEVVMPENINRFVICGSTDLYKRPYIKMKGIVCDVDESGVPKGRVMNVGWQLFETNAVKVGPRLLPWLQSPN
eukprot:SM000018S03653  [mRNA]  locus=s18:582667:583515:- [translate_table: standard]